MTPLPDPITSPIGFMWYFLVFYVLSDPIAGTLKIALYSSVLLYPFILLGDSVYSRMKKSLKTGPLAIFYIAGFVMSAIFWLAMQLLSVVSGGGVIMGSFLDIVSMFFAMSIGVLVFGMLGHRMLRSLERRYEMPKYVSYFIVDYAINVVAWSIWVAHYFV